MAGKQRQTDALKEASSVLINKKIAELKKKILLAEGLKTATREEWDQQEKSNSESIVELKKGVKSLTNRLTYFNNVNDRKMAKESVEVSRKVAYPAGARSAEEALQIYDMTITNMTKQYDLLNARYLKRKEHFYKLYGEQQSLANLKGDAVTDSAIEQMPVQTVDEDENRKLVWHLENEIHRTNVQWTEAEHIRKKYKSIKASLMIDAEKFEKSLLELEEAFRKQDSDVKRMQEVHGDALQMRDSTKVVLLRHEHTANTVSKSRQRQAFDFRRQVEERKVELERLERKLFATNQTFTRQGSMESLSGDTQQNASNPDGNLSNKTANDSTSNIEDGFKILMQATGATNSKEVHAMFSAQKEATTRLNYLRNVTEAEKKHLETERDQLTAQMDGLKIYDTKENEVNQELVEKLKNNIWQQKNMEREYLQAAELTKNVLNSNRATLSDLILKLEEIDENSETFDATGGDFIDTADVVNGKISNESLLQILSSKLKKGLISTRQMTPDSDRDSKAIDGDTLHIPLIDFNALHDGSMTSARRSARSLSVMGDTDLHSHERPTPYPTCYANLLAGRTTGTSSTTTSGQMNQPGITDDEEDIPSRNALKRQALLLVDSKSRRKGFRAPPKKR